MKYFSLLLISVALILSSCKKENDPPYLSLSPGTIDQTYPPGALIEFNIEAFGGDNDLRNLLITEKPLNSTTTTIKDTTLSGNRAEFNWVYETPSSGVESVVLRFKITDTEGLSNTFPIRVNIDGGATLQETSGYQLYSYYNSINDGFNISNADFISIDAPDSDTTLIDILEYNLDNDSTLSRAWTSYTGLRFVRNNDYNYSAATNASAENTFDASSQQQIVSNLLVNDILITKYDTINNLFAVIKIVNIIDDEGLSNDRYEFNLKK